jgi:hypothetical protein
MRAILAILLLGEAGLTALWLAGQVPLLGVHGSLVLFLAGLRAGVAAVQFAAGFLWLRRLPPAALFTRWSMLASAVLLTVELGAGLSPTSVFPTFRWPIVAVYGTYALAVAWVGSLIPAPSGPPRPR